jgi:tRNA-dihydrouridine synthase B
MPHIGHIQLATPFCQAGLAGYSDRAMRVVARRRGCPYAVTESLLDVILLSGGQGLRKSIDINDEDHPVAGQIIGSDPDAMARAAQILASAGYDVIDLNFACPVKKIKAKSRGGHMLLDADRAIAVLNAARDRLPPHVPMTLSLRRGFDDTAESEDRFYQIVESAWAAGYAAVRVHARTVEQKYLGQARWSFLREVKQRYPEKTILGSGDLFTAEDAVRMLRETGVDMAWIARGAIGNPWIFQHAAVLLAAGGDVGDVWSGDVGSGDVAIGDSTPHAPRPHAPRIRSPHTPPGLTPPTIHEQREALAEHFGIAMQIHGEQLAGRRMRKMGIKYSRFHPQAEQVKRDFIEVRSLRDWNATLDKWYDSDGPGVWPSPNAADEVNEAAVQTCEPVS